MSDKHRWKICKKSNFIVRVKLYGPEHETIQSDKLSLFSSVLSQFEFAPHRFCIARHCKHFL